MHGSYKIECVDSHHHITFYGLPDELRSHLNFETEVIVVCMKSINDAQIIEPFHISMTLETIFGRRFRMDEFMYKLQSFYDLAHKKAEEQLKDD